VDDAWCRTVVVDDWLALVEVGEVAEESQAESVEATISTTEIASAHNPRSIALCPCPAELGTRKSGRLTLAPLE